MKLTRNQLSPAAWLLSCAAAMGTGFLAGASRRQTPATAATSASIDARPLVAGMVAEGRPRSAAMLRADLVESLAELDGGARTERLRGVGRELSQFDPAVAWGMQRDIASPADRENYALAVLGPWSAVDPWGAVTAAAALPGGRLHTACTAAALAGLAKSDVAAALEFASHHLTGAARESAVTGVVQAWAAQDAPAAAAWAQSHLSTPGASGALRAAVQTWADTNPAAASQWVAGLPSGDLTGTAVRALVQTWGEQTPYEAAAWVSSRGPGDIMEAASPALAGEWAASDPRAAAEWAVTLPRTSTARIAASRALGEWAAVAPQEAAAWLAEKGPDLPDLAPALYRSLGSGWAAQDPAAAASWVQEVPDPYLQEESVPMVFNTWAAMDTGGLAEWLRANAASPFADAAREQLALVHSDSSPEAALAVALQVSAPDGAAHLSRRILDDWRARDLPAANQWTAANPQAAQLTTLHR